MSDVTAIDNEPTVSIHALEGFADWMKMVRDDFGATTVAGIAIDLVLDGFKDMFGVGPW